MSLWNKFAPRTASAATSIIDEGCELFGRLVFIGTLALNGKFTGEIHSSDTLLVGETGNLEGKVHVRVAIISGQVKGQIHAVERVVLRPTARVNGEIHTPGLHLEEGMIFDGRCTMMEERTGIVEPLPLKRQAHG